MAITTENIYTGDGSTRLYSFTFPYIDERDVRVSFDGNLKNRSQYTFANATTLKFDEPPGDGKIIRIFRDTEVDTIPNTFFPGSTIRARDLNDNFTQGLYIAQESATNTEFTKDLAEEALDNSEAAVSTANSAEALANAAQSTADSATTIANAALPKSGGTMTGPIVFDESQTGLGTEVGSTPQVAWQRVPHAPRSRRARGQRRRRPTSHLTKSSTPQTSRASQTVQCETMGA